MKIKINCEKLATDLKDLTCMKCDAEPWQCHECEITAEINEIIRNSVKDVSIEI